MLSCRRVHVELALCLGILFVSAPGALPTIAQTPAYSAYNPVPVVTQPSKPQNPVAGSTLTVVPEDFSRQILSPGYLLDLQEFDMPEISSQLRVDDQGDVSVPLAGRVHVAGLSLPAAREAIRKELIQKEILKNPHLNLDVLQYSANYITVLGEVQSPGRLQLLAPHPLSEVLAMAGGETALAGNKVVITQRVDGRSEARDVHFDRNSVLNGTSPEMVLPGDSVLVPRAGIVYVLGGVSRPGGYIMQEGGHLDVAEALSIASGTALNAAVGSIRVIRKMPDGSLATLPVPYKKMTKGEVTPMQLQAGDIVYVPVSKFKSVLSAGISASASSALIYSVR